MSRASTIRLLAVSCTLFALGSGWARPSRAADISLTPIGNLDVGGFNMSVITSDLNRDGALDLITTSLEFNRASVFLGNGDGTFRARSDYATANEPHSVAAGDLNLDGIPDLLVANAGAGTVSVLIGVGDGTFVRGTDFEASPTPYFVGIADVNGDGRPDAIGAVSSSIFVRLGNGDGTFGPRTDVALAGCAVGEIQAADLNGDGRLDLAVTNNCSGLVHILLGHGDGSFQPPLSYSADGSPLSCDIGDLNGDGRLDLVVSGGAALAVSVFLGNGDGTFLPRTDYGTDVAPISVRIGDFNSDTIPDLAVTTGEGRALDVLAGRGDGTFDPKHGYPTGPGYALAVGDWDRDGLLDLAASTFDQMGRLSLFRNTPGVPVGNSPVLTAPPSASGNVGTEITFTVSAADPDGEPITELGVSPLLPGASFTVDPSQTSGTFRWTPTSAELGGPYRVVFFAYNSLATSARTHIYIGPGGSNRPPVLDPIGSKAVNELAPLTFTATATYPDAGQTLTFLLFLGAPAATGATLNGTTGAFNWTPTEAQGPGSYSITVQVVDNGSPQLNAVEGITIAVNEVNVAPVLAAIGNKAACAVGSPFTFTATATDTDVPANVLTFSLDPGAPSGATINGSTGVFNWTPSSPGSFPVTIRVTDNGTPPLNDFEAITITVSPGEPNQPPVLSAIGNKTVNELTPLAFTVVASDPGPCPGETLTFSLDAGAPAGATINGSTGAFTWTPAEAQGPGTFPITVRVTDNGSPPLSDFETITVTVNEVNSAPVVANPGNKFVTVLSTLAFTVTATDSDIPANTIAWSLTLGTPAATGATINSSTGAFSWTPTQAQANQVYPVTITATDNGTPVLSGSAAITVTVNEANQAPVLSPIGGKSGTVQVLLTFTATATDPNAGQTLTFSLDAGAPVGATMTPGGTFSWTPACGQNGTFPVTIRVTDNGIPPLSDFEAITITIGDPGNPSPVLATIGNKTVNEGFLLSFTATATDSDAGDVLTFSLDSGAPAGAAINGASGAFTWTPTEAQGPGSHPITVRVTDNGECPATDFETITVMVNEVNVSPVLAPIGNKTACSVGAPFTFTVTATDADLPANVLTFSLDPGAPSGAAINASTGAFSWTPSTTGTFPVTVRVADNGTPTLDDFEVVTITVSPGAPNQAPVLGAIGNKTVNELAALAFTAVASDPGPCPGETLTFSLDAGAPIGTTINGSTGVFTWTPTEAQGPGTFPITIRVTDNGSPPLSDFETIQVTVNEFNSAPVLAAIGNKTGAIGTPTTFTATATDSDIPANTLTFSLDAGAPPGATINAATGAFSWTPSTTGTFPVTIRVTDNGTPPLSDFETITIVMGGGPGQAPVLAAIGNKTVNELTLLAFTATATDPNAGEVLTFSLDAGAPAGTTINGSSGAFVWTPTEAQGPGVYPITVRVTDNGSPPLSDFETIQVTVNEFNSPPVLTPIGNKSGTIGTPVTFTATATDADIPANTLTFSLDAGAPPGATIGASTGAFSWTPTNSGTVPVTIRVTDNGTPPLSDFETITIVPALGAGQAPVLSPIGNKTVNELVLLAFTATATDPNAGDVLTFSLDAGAPAGATIGASTGAFSWTPSEAQGPGSRPITVRVTDNGSPPQSDFETFTVTVNEVNQAPVLTPIGNKTVTAGSTLALTATATDADIPPNTLCFSLDSGSPPGATMTCGTGAFMWTPSLGQIGLYSITVRVTDNGIPPLSDSETITVLVSQPESRPTADAGGPYTGIVNSPLSFDGTGSSDPNGEVLTYLWNFGDGNTGAGATPMHIYTAPGNYNVVLRVTDPEGNFDEDVTTVTILAEIPVTLLLKNGKSTINLGDPDVLKLGIEELEQPYASVLVGTARLSTDFPNAGTVAECSADTKHTRIGDLDRNGVSDLELRFPIACIRDLFRNTPNNSTVNLILTGQFQTSTGTVPLRGVKAVTIKRGGGGSAPVLAYPNPFNPQGRLSFMTTRPGSASIQLFDLQGRLVRTLLPRQYLGPGDHEIAIDGLNDQGIGLSSGIYFYRVSTADGVTEGSISVLK